MNVNIIRREVEKITCQASFNLRPDVLMLIKKAYRAEANKKAKCALSRVIENAKVAKRERLAICQDTGLPIVFIEAGADVKISSRVKKIIENAVMQSYRKNYLRASLVRPFQRKNPSYSPALTHLEFNEKMRGLRLTVFPKGFGSENKARLRMFNPTAAWSKVEDFIIEAVREAGPEACPPFIVGVGIGGTSDYALLLAKKVLVGEIHKPNKDKSLAGLENRLLKRINSLKIGPMGLGGMTTALAVKIKVHPTHIAGLPVGVNISCWALRSASVKLDA